MNLRNNTTKLGFTNVRVIQAEARQWLISEAASDPFDVVFVDPLLPTTCFMTAAPACQRAGCWLKRQKCIWNTIRQSITQNCPPAGHSLKPNLRAGFTSGSILFPEHSSPNHQRRECPIRTIKMRPDTTEKTFEPHGGCRKATVRRSGVSLRVQSPSSISATGSSLKMAIL